MVFFKGNALAQLLLQSDAMTKFILFVLLLMSIVCWTIFLYKIVLFVIKGRQMHTALKYLKKIHTIDDLRIMAAEFSNTLPGYVINKNLLFLKSFLEIKDAKNPLSEHELELLQQRIEQTIDGVVHREQSYLPILFSSAAVSPLLGLFGTIWGLMHSFVNISQKQQADIVTIAPGLAEALITTLAGLMVAIPSLLMFHYLNNEVRHIEQKLYNLADRLAWIVQMIFMQQR